MSLQLINDHEYDPGFDPEALAAQVAERVLDLEKCPYECEIALTLVNNEEIRELNREHRGFDRATDVLSFPMASFSAPACYDDLEDSPDNFNPETGELMLGDIVISLERAEEQAAQFGHSLRREFAFLTAHSMLHLLGYDHMTEEEEREMFRRQEEVLDSLGITRDN